MEGQGRDGFSEGGVEERNEGRGKESFAVVKGGKRGQGSDGDLEDGGSILDRKCGERTTHTFPSSVPAATRSSNSETSKSVIALEAT